MVAWPSCHCQSFLHDFSVIPCSATSPRLSSGLPGTSEHYVSIRRSTARVRFVGWLRFPFRYTLCTASYQAQKSYTGTKAPLSCVSPLYLLLAASPSISMAKESPIYPDLPHPVLLHPYDFLRLTSPHVPGEIPKGIGQLTRLKRLNFSSCQLVGENISCRHGSTKIHRSTFLSAAWL